MENISFRVKERGYFPTKLANVLKYQREPMEIWQERIRRIRVSCNTNILNVTYILKSAVYVKIQYAFI